MKIESLAKSFTQKNGKPLIIAMHDSITDFKRILELRHTFKETKDVYKTYIEKRNDMVTELINRHCDLVDAEALEKDPKANKIDRKTITEVPEYLMEEYTQKHKLMLETEVKLKNFVKFTQDELKNSGFVQSEMELIEDFILFEK